MAPLSDPPILKAPAMIFVTVGTQLPFDRLISAVSDWAVRNPSQKVVAQTGAGRADFPGILCQPTLDQTAFRATLEAAEIVIAHAGMGSILMAAEAGKPIIIMPRRADIGEHRNDHQSDTAAEMAALSNVHVVKDAAQLGQTLTTLLQQAPASAAVLSSSAQPQLLAALRDFIWAEARQPARPRFQPQRVAS